MAFNWGSPSGTNSAGLEDEEGARYGWARILASSLAIASGGRTKSTQPAAMAFFGMLSNLADFSSWAKVMPPSALIAANPNVPSEAVPERIIPIALLLWSSASERKKRSMGMGWPRVSVRAVSRNIPCEMVMSTLGGITYTWLGFTGVASATCLTGISVAFARSSVSALSWLGSRC